MSDNRTCQALRQDRTWPKEGKLSSVWFGFAHAFGQDRQEMALAAPNLVLQEFKVEAESQSARKHLESKRLVDLWLHPKQISSKSQENAPKCSI